MLKKQKQKKNSAGYKTEKPLKYFLVWNSFEHVCQALKTRTTYFG